MTLLRLLVAFVALGLLAACQPAATGDVSKDVQNLKTEVAMLKEKVGQLEAEAKKIQEQLKELAKVSAVTAPAPAMALPGLAPGAPAAIDVAQLLKDKDRLLGTRVTVRGQPGPVLMHKKILYLQSPDGLIEVNFSQLADKKQLERITAQAIETPVTVTGTMNQALGTGKGPTRLLIMAEAVDF